MTTERDAEMLLDAEGAAEHILDVYGRGESLDPALARPAAWATAVAGLLQVEQNGAVRHVIGTLVDSYPVRYFASVQTMLISEADAGPDAEVQVEQKSDIATPEIAAAVEAVMAAYRAGENFQIRPGSRSEWAQVLLELMKSHDVDVAKYAAAALEERFTNTWYFGAIRKALAAVPRSNGSGFTDDSENFCQIVPFPGSDTLLVVFTAGNARHLALPLKVIHAWLGRLGVHLVYLREVRGTMFMRGAPALAPDYSQTVQALRKLADNLNAPRIVCLGNSLTGYSAIRYAIDLQASAALSFAPITHFSPATFSNIASHARKRGVKGVTPTRLMEMDLRPRLEEASRRPDVRIVYSGANDADKRQAEHLHGIPGVELRPLPGVTRHHALLIGIGDFETHLRWLVSARKQ